ncbi:DUF6907 domain-containing protein [Nocardioides sp. Iso805N]|uniref:DUF6907 domain-containing protein n=1 Tax=Nocardioides sp. Iso805N TaxID=1283287 RepID=UPI0003794230|nr:hypothetical protein [Nocardioides sp. Iso805N]
MTELLPTWQREPCPRWCIRDHDEDDIALDRYHQGSATTVPVLMSTDSEEPRSATYVPVDLAIRVGRYAGELIDWVAIEPVRLTAPRLVLTAESAARLAEQVTAQLAEHVALDQA